MKHECDEGKKKAWKKEQIDLSVNAVKSQGHDTFKPVQYG